MKRGLIVIGVVLALAGCDDTIATLAGPDYEPVPEGFKRAPNPLPEAVAQVAASYRLPASSIITKDGCYYSHIEPGNPDLVSPLRTTGGAPLCTAK